MKTYTVTYDVGKYKGCKINFNAANMKQAKQVCKNNITAKVRSLVERSSNTTVQVTFLTKEWRTA